jgi:L-alanine-DL-glutamate epimerase-like enolase superfamily enzyme
MKITDVKTHLLGIPISQDRLPTPWFWGSFNQIIVSVHTDEGITGYGEAFGYGVPHATAAVIDKTLRPMLIGEDPTRISTLQDKLFRQTHLFGRYGVTVFAISGIDIALWDIAGKCAGLPLYRLFGGARTDRIPAYASLVRYSDTHTVRAAVEHALAAGYDGIKLHQLDVESLKITRELAGPDAKLMMDINCAWTLKEAVQKAWEFAPYDLLWLEEPLWPPEDFAGLARVKTSGGIPIGSGENACTVYQFHQMLASGAAAYIQPSVVKVGGISEWRKIAGLAESYNVSIAPHSPYFGPGFIATVHLIASTAQAVWLEYIYLFLEANVFKDFPSMKNGSVTVPQGPGLGLEIDLDVMDRYRLDV